MLKIILTYGAISGAVIIAAIGIGLASGTEGGSSVWLGYLIMLVALSLIFVGIKRYRDRDLGGVIRFATALGVGLGIATIASLTYVTIWEIYLWFTDYAFIGKYAQSMIAAKQAAGAGVAEIAKLRAEMALMVEQYNSKPVYRLGMTFVEIFPVGVIVSLVSAGLLRNSRLLPARGSGAAA